jgi:hypothetical protein
MMGHGHRIWVFEKELTNGPPQETAFVDGCASSRKTEVGTITSLSAADSASSLFSNLAQLLHSARLRLDSQRQKAKRAKSVDLVVPILELFWR